MLPCSALRLRVKKYLENLKLYIQKLLSHDSIRRILGEYPELLQNISLYLKDAEEFYRRGDWFSALVAVVYAEGLLDSLKFLGRLESSWPSERPRLPRVAVVFRERCPSRDLIAALGLLYSISRVEGILVKSSGKYLELYRALRYLDSVEVAKDYRELGDILLSENPDAVIFLDQELWEAIASKLRGPVIYLELEDPGPGNHGAHPTNPRSAKAGHREARTHRRDNLQIRASRSQDSGTEDV